MKKAKWWMSLVGAGAVVALTAGAGLWVTQYNALEVDPPALIDAPAAVVAPLEAGELDAQKLQGELARMASDPALGTFGVKIVDVTSETVVFEQEPQRALTPASSTKLLTAAAAMLKLGPGDVITTKVFASGEREVTIQGSGDVWLTQEQVNALAAQIREQMPNVQSVLVDVSTWPGKKVLEGWNPEDIDGGFVAPLEPLMINQGRLGQATGDVPRSHAPAFDVARALAGALGAGTFGYTDHINGEEIASTQSPTLEHRVSMMMEDSDNVMAEAIARELDPLDPTGATMRVLSEAGLPTQGSSISDNSGLSLQNRITPELLEAITTKAVEDPALRPLLATLPIAGASGTLADRFVALDGRGWVRAKTGTLTEVAALAGVVPSASGHMLSFAMISNGAEVTGARRHMDEIATALRNS